LTGHPSLDSPHLTPRQSRILKLVAEGMGNKEIAAACDVSEQTIKGHVSRLLILFAAPNRAALVHRAIQVGAITSMWIAMM